MSNQIEKQAIEEMAKVIERTEQIARDAHCGLPSPTMYAKDLYWHGYRKQSEVVEEYRKKVYSKMEKYTVFGREYIQRIMREVEKEMKGGAE